MKTNPFILIIALLSLFGINSSNAQSTYLAYDALNGANTTPLNTSFGGTGWNAAWTVQNNVNAGYTFSPTALSYANLQTYGGSSNGGYNYATAGRLLDYDDGGAFDNYVTGSNLIGSSTGTTLYVSALLKKNNNNSTPVFEDLHNSNVAWCNDCATSNRVGFGYFGTQSDVGGEKRWSLRIGTGVYASSVPVDINQSAFFVLKITFNSNTTVLDLFINPTSLGTSGEPTTPTLSITSNTLIRIRSCALYLGNTSGEGVADELRFASNYSTAAPDNTVTLNLPPTGDFSMSQSSGTTPISINFDATASVDPEGQPLTYSWNFGDGSPIQTGNAFISHTYSAGLSGIVPVILTVTDNLGQQHSPQKNLTLFLPNSTSFPCQTTITNIQEATCNQNDGKVRINLGSIPNPAITFNNASGQSQSATNGNEFHNLSPGNYAVTITSSNGCADTYTLNMTTNNTSCAGWQAPQCDMSIGTNVNGMADWSWEHAFINRYKHVRSDVITYHDGCNCWDENVAAQLAFDTDGYPTSIPQSTSASALTKIRYILSSENGNLKANEQYVFLYDGVGSFTLNGATTNSNTAGRLLFTIGASSVNIWIDVSSSQSGNYMRNFRLLKANEENVNLSQNTFNPTFISRLSPFKAIRFMDWGHTNGSPLSSWTGRKKVSERTYSGNRGVPYEMMIALANQTQKDVWICVPHLADNDYIVQMATLFRDNLNPNLKIYLEYSNEVWNWIFEQAQWNNNNKPANLSYGRAYSEKAKNVFQLWTSVFNGQTSRMYRVLGLQGGYNSLNQEIMAQLGQNEWDMASPTFYFGLNHGASGNPVLTASSTGDDVNLNARNAYFGTNGWLQSIKQDYRNIKIFGKEIVCYEGGQHYTDFNTHPYQQAMYDAQYLPSMYSLYNDVLDSIRNLNTKLAMTFTLSGVQESVYGSWGHLPDMYMSPPYLTIAPKYQVILDNSCLPFQNTMPLVLSVDLLDFNVQLQHQNNVLITWDTQNEQDISKYEIEKSNDGIAFVKIFEKNVVQKNDNFHKRYQALDQILKKGVYYYRLKTVENDNRSDYSNIVSITISESNFISIYPNPIADKINIKIENSDSNSLYGEKYSIRNAMGQIIQSGTIETNDITLDSISAGIYYLQINDTIIKMIKK